MEENKKKADHKNQSLILGALTSSAGIFVTKLLGLFYMTPFTALAGEENLVFYSYAYGVYQNLLNISLAGLPYAIATLVAKYYLKEDYKAVKFIRQLSRAIMMGFGFLSMVTVVIGVTPIARYITPAEISALDLQRTKNVLYIISLAFFTVPLLSGVRGYYQGLKDMRIYSVSQVIEQMSRIAFLLGMAFFSVRILHLNGIWAVYGAVGSAFVSSAIALVHIYYSRRDVAREMDQKAAAQSSFTQNGADLLRELLSFSVPYLISTLLGNSLSIVNSTFFSKAMDAAGYDHTQTMLLTSMLMLTCDKLVSIPHFLVTGYSSAIVPYVTTSYEKGDLKQLKQYIIDAIESVTYLGLPLCYFLFAIGSEIYYVMYGGRSYVLGGEVLRWDAISAFLGTVSPIVTALAMATRLRRQNLTFMLLGFIVKLVTFFPLIRICGYSGAIISSALCSLTIMGLNLLAINKNYFVDYRPTFVRIVKMAAGLLGMSLVFMVLKLIGLRVVDQPRMKALFELAFYGIFGLLAYVSVTSLFRIPETIFHIQDDKNVFTYLMGVLRRVVRR